MTLGVAIIAASATVAGLWAQTRAQNQLPGADWVQLLNGTDLSGWRNVGVESWKVEADGVLRGKSITKAYGYLETTRDYSNFVLSLRFRCVERGNSGVYFHTRFAAGTVDVNQGGQFEIDCNLNHHTGGVYHWKKGWLVWPAPENEAVVRQSDWNDYTLIVDGNRYISRLNGVQMVDYTDPNAELLSGAIALQLHAGGTAEMLFKDIYLREIGH
jgi:hypothetical protein